MSKIISKNSVMILKILAYIFVYGLVIKKNISNSTLGAVSMGKTYIGWWPSNPIVRAHINFLK